MNEFADLSDEEFASIYLSKIDPNTWSKGPIKTDFSAPRWDMLVEDPDPNNWDWYAAISSCIPYFNNVSGLNKELLLRSTNKAAVGTAGMFVVCRNIFSYALNRAFAATETMESYWALAGNNLTSLSVV